MSRVSLARALMLALTLTRGGCMALVATLAGACHEPEQPPFPPSRPTNPTNDRVSQERAREEGLTAYSGELDASILPEAGSVHPNDAGVGLFDAIPVTPR